MAQLKFKKNEVRINQNRRANLAYIKAKNHTAAVTACVTALITKEDLRTDESLSKDDSPDRSSASKAVITKKDKDGKVQSLMTSFNGSRKHNQHFENDNELLNIMQNISNNNSSKGIPVKSTPDNFSNQN